MSTIRNPVGPQSPKVYWRRRLIVGLGLLAVVVIIILIIVRPGSGNPKPADTKSPISSGTNTPDPSGASTTPATDGVECDLSKVTLDAVTDATSYEPGVNPKLSFTLKSLMTTPCIISVGTDLQEFRITSGDELIWNSKDCQTESAAAQTELKPGVPSQSTPFEWDRTRSSVDTCDVPGEAVVADGASYHLEVILGELESKSTKQFLLY